MTRPKFYLVIAFAGRCILCARCERFLNSVGRSPCKRALKFAAELQRMQEAAVEVSAQPADREPDPEADPPAQVSLPFDEEAVIDSFLNDQRRAREDRVMEARAARAAHREAARRQARRGALPQQQQPV